LIINCIMNQNACTELRDLPHSNPVINVDLPGSHAPEVNPAHAATLTEKLLDFGTYEYDLKNQTLHCSPGVYYLFGFEPGTQPVSADGSFLTEHIDNETVQTFWNLLRRATPAAGQFEHSFNIRPRNLDEVKAIMVSGVFVPLEGGHPGKVVGMMRNINHQKEKEEATYRHILELERSNNDLEGFAYVASHDLQEPLRKIVTFADMLINSQSSLADKDKDYLLRIHKSAHDMRALIDNLLEYAHIGQTDAPVRILSMNLIVQQSLSDLELKINEKKPLIEVAPLPDLLVNPERMRRVFTNLIGNAIKFGKKDQTVHIRILQATATAEEIAKHHLDPQCTYAKIVVQDNGIGFEKEYQQRIFQIFQRLHGRSAYPGSGLGLAICKRIIEQHNGHICAESEKGQGASFSILLPLPGSQK